MSRKIIPAANNNGLDAPYLSSNHKVMQYLQNTGHCSNANNNNSSFNAQHKNLGLRNNMYDDKYTFMNNNQCNQRMRSCSENNSTPYDIDRLTQFNLNFGSCLSDPGGYRSILSSNTSSSGICSTLSDASHEESISTSPEDLDFNLGFDQISNSDEIELDDPDEVDENEHGKKEKAQISNKINGCRYDQRQWGSMFDHVSHILDTATLLGFGKSNSDTRINELEGFFQKSDSSTTLNSNTDVNNDDLTATNNRKQEQNASLLRDSTSTLCSQDIFSSYAEQSNNDENNDDGDMENAVFKRSNSLGIALSDRKAVLLDKPPKKVVRFADMLGLDLESVRYMTPPDHSASLMMQECIRMKLDQLRQAKSLSNSLSSSPSPFDLPTIFNRSSSLTSLAGPTKRTHQYYLISKYFTPPTDIIPLIYDRQVMLECLYTNDSIAYGTVRVHNLAYDKRVFVRLTEDDWKSFQDVYGWFSMNYKNNNTDTFTFEISLKKYDDPSKVPKQIYFAVCLQAGHREFWDNNLGWNYVLDVLERR